MGGDVRERLGRLFDLGPPQTAGGGQAQPGELFRGDGWYVTQGVAGCELHYISGELAGRSKTLAISPSEADRLREDQGELDAILIAHGAT